MEPGFDQNYWNKMQNLPDGLESQSFSKSTLCRYKCRTCFFRANEHPNLLVDAVSCILNQILGPETFREQLREEIISSTLVNHCIFIVQVEAFISVLVSPLLDRATNLLFTLGKHKLVSSNLRNPKEAADFKVFLLNHQGRVKGKSPMKEHQTYQNRVKRHEVSD